MENPPFEDVFPMFNIGSFEGCISGKSSLFFDIFIRMSRSFLSGELLDYDGGWIWQAEELNKFYIPYNPWDDCMFAYTYHENQPFM